MRWIKLHKKFIEWEWHDIPEMVSLFIHLLILAQHEDYQWRGCTILRGQLVTSRAKLAKVTGLSQRTIRTCMERLIATNEVTKKATNRNTLITICNYDKYQDNPNQSDQLNDQQFVQQATNHQTRYIEDNIVVVDTRAREGLLEMALSPAKVESGCMSMYISPDEYRTLVRQIINDWQFTDESDWSLKHLLNTLRIKVEENRRKKSQNNGTDKTTNHDGNGQHQTTNPLARAKVFKAYQS